MLVTSFPLDMAGHCGTQRRPLPSKLSVPRSLWFGNSGNMTPEELASTCEMSMPELPTIERGDMDEAEVDIEMIDCR